MPGIRLGTMIQWRVSNLKVKVYVAGPYTKPDPCENTNRAVMIGNQLYDLGYIPFIPHLTHFWHTMTPRPYEDWMALDMAWLEVSNIVYRFSGESSGADREVARANELGIPVVYSIEELLALATQESE
jgi:hypothetical protein